MAHLGNLTYRIEDVAKLLGIGRNSAYDAAKRGDIPTIKVGRRILVPRAALHRLLDGENHQPKDAAEASFKNLPDPRRAK